MLHLFLIQVEFVLLQLKKFVKLHIEPPW